MLTPPQTAPLPPAVILGMTTNGLSFVRSLGRRGIPVFMLDTPAGHPGMRSRYGSPRPLPDLVEQPEEWSKALDEIARQAAAPPVLIATGDEHLLFLAKHRRQLESRFRLRIPPGELPEQLCDKRRQHECLERLGCPLPKTVYPEPGADLVALAERTVGFPCLLKPYSSHHWSRRKTGAKLAFTPDRDRLRAAAAMLAPSGHSFLLQEVIPGGDDALHAYSAYLGAGSHPLGAMTKQKLRQQPPDFGNGSLQISTCNSEIRRISEQILRQLGYEGLVSIEYKWDARDERYKLIEINPRSISGNQLVIDSGVDLPAIYYHDQLGWPPPAAPPYRAGVKYLHLGWDFQSYLAQRRTGRLNFLSWLRSLWGVRSFALFDWRDPRPFLAYLGAALRSIRPG